VAGVVPSQVVGYMITLGQVKDVLSLKWRGRSSKTLGSISLRLDCQIDPLGVQVRLGLHKNRASEQRLVLLRT
jgi:hypothetical protein